MEEIILRSKCRNCKKEIEYVLGVTPIHQIEYCCEKCWHDYFHTRFSGPRKPEWKIKLAPMYRLEQIQHRLEGRE